MSEDSPATKQSIAGSKLNGDKVEFRFANGETIDVDLNALPETSLRTAAGIGVQQLVRVAYNGAADVEEAYQMASRRISALLDGTYKVAARGGGKSEPNDLERALMEALGGKNLTYVRDTFIPGWFAKQGLREVQARNGGTRLLGQKEALNKLRAHPEVAPVLARHAAERAKAAGRTKSNEGGLSSILGDSSHGDPAERPAQAA